MRKDGPLLIPHPSSLIPQRRPVALRRSLFRGVAASIRKQLRAASAAWQPCGRRRVDFLRLGPALCVPAFRRVCLFGPGTEAHASAPLQDTGRRGAELSPNDGKPVPLWVELPGWLELGDLCAVRRLDGHVTAVC